MPDKKIDALTPGGMTLRFVEAEICMRCRNSCSQEEVHARSATIASATAQFPWE
jgi:hypothetical protein